MNRLFYSSDDLVILAGKSPRPDKYHCVVGKVDCWGFEIVHDPHEDNTGIVGQPYGIKWIINL